jgi:hypothetical protein
MVNRTMYKIKKQGAFYLVLTVTGERVQFKSTHRMLCVEWIAENGIKI